MASYSANQIILEAFQQLGLYASNETMADSDAELALSVLNGMLDGWAGDYTYVYQLSQRTLTLVSSQASYTIGTSGANLTAPRPFMLNHGPAAATVTISAVTTNVNVVSALEWNMIESVSPGTGTPNTLYYDPTWPSGTLKVAPTPNANGTLSFYAIDTPVTSFSALATSVNLAQGVYEGLYNNLAVLMQPFFDTGNLNQVTTLKALTGKETIKRQSLASRAFLPRSGVPTPSLHRPPAIPSQQGNEE